MSRIAEIFRSPGFNYFGMVVGLLFIALSVANWMSDAGTQAHEVLESAKDITLWVMMMVAFVGMAALPRKNTLP